MENTMKSVEMTEIKPTPPIHLMKSLAAFQYECPIIHKGTKGFGYSYADLPTIIEAITPFLKKNQLGFTQSINGSMLTTFVFHTESGESIESNMEINSIEMKGMNMMQSFGACLSYYRRYSLISILGIVTDSDIDANGQPKKRAEKNADDPGAKKPLNQKQFSRAMAEIQAGKYTKEFIIESFVLTPEQRLSIDEMNA